MGFQGQKCLICSFFNMLPFCSTMFQEESFSSSFSGKVPSLSEMRILEGYQIVDAIFSFSAPQPTEACAFPFGSIRVLPCTLSAWPVQKLAIPIPLPLLTINVSNLLPVATLHCLTASSCLIGFLFFLIYQCIYFFYLQYMFSTLTTLLWFLLSEHIQGNATNDESPCAVCIQRLHAYTNLELIWNHLAHSVFSPSRASCSFQEDQSTQGKKKWKTHVPDVVLHPTATLHCVFTETMIAARGKVW